MNELEFELQKQNIISSLMLSNYAYVWNTLIEIFLIFQYC